MSEPLDLDAIRARVAYTGPIDWSIEQYAFEDRADLLDEVDRLRREVADEIEEKNDVCDGYRDHAYAMVERAKRAEAEVGRLERLVDTLRSQRDTASDMVAVRHHEPVKRFPSPVQPEPAHGPTPAAPEPPGAAWDGIES